VATITLSLVLLDGTRAWSDDAVETIVLVRHGEKPDKGLGQLDCQGLNRALALTPVIAKTFGRPSAIFAPDPSRQKQDDGAPYDYVRPLATIEPTAIFFPAARQCEPAGRGGPRRYGDFAMPADTLDRKQKLFLHRRLCGRGSFIAFAARAFMAASESM
jgi:hypothetical protein